MTAGYEPHTSAPGQPPPSRPPAEAPRPEFRPVPRGESTGEMSTVRITPSWSSPRPGPAAAPPPHPYPPPPPVQFGPPPPVPVVAAGGRRPVWRTLLVLALVLGLAGVAGFQAYRIDQLDERLRAADQRLADAQAADGSRLDGIEGRTSALEQQAGKAFNPEAISTAVLPSVFRVSAGRFTGTAFAVGKPAVGGGTNLLTNFHVVESVWAAGDRQVFVERRDRRIAARIVRVDADDDIALLTTAGKYPGLVTARGAVKSGQQIVVIGAPLGLEDTVTTGVVSAFRKEQDGSGPVIQFDAPINPGNSGGPVVNAGKQVVGIATAKARDAEGIGLAVPIKTACDTFKVC